MQKLAVIQISEAGSKIASTLTKQLGASVIHRTDIGKEWKHFDAFVFIGAMGICVRTIAPYIKDKHEDPAVVCVDSMGLNVVSDCSIDRSPRGYHHTEQQCRTMGTGYV